MILRIENRARLTHFWPKKLPFLAYSLYANNVDEIFIRIHTFANMCIIRMNCIFLHLHDHPQLKILCYGDIFTGCVTKPQSAKSREIKVWGLLQLVFHNILLLSSILHPPSRPPTSAGPILDQIIWPQRSTHLLAAGTYFPQNTIEEKQQSFE